MTAPSESGIFERALTAADLPAAVALSTAAGWNQTAEDWRYLLAMGRGFALAAPDDGALVATALTLPYGAHFGWISMVLVDHAHRGRGFATRLIARCVETLRAASLVPVLDATPAGQHVYRRLGFRDAWTFRRFRRSSGDRRIVAEAPAGVALRPFTERDLTPAAALDRIAFGADRRELLGALRRRLPGAALVAERGGDLVGFALARDGCTAAQVGPVVAEEAAVGAALVASALGAVAGAALVDVPDRRRCLQGALAAAGLEEERGFTRMLHERAQGFDDPERLFAIAGPELG